MSTANPLIVNEGIDLHANMNWPDGWFILDQGDVQGPFSTQKIFCEDYKDAAEVSEELMVSRKGFRRWYTLRDLLSIYAQGNQLGVANLSSIQSVEDELSQAIESLSSIENEVQQSVSMHLAEIERTNTELHQAASFIHQETSRQLELEPSFEKKLATKVTSVEATPLVKAKSLSPTGLSSPESHVKKSAETAKTSLLKGTWNRGTLGSKKDKKTANPQQEKQQREIAYYHLMYAGKLRLGPIANPWIESFAKFIAGFGLYWGVWVRNTAVTATAHLDGSAIKNSNRLMWLALIPGYHFLMANKIAKAVQALEIQNGYKTVSTLTATLLAVFPPLTMLYLQRALNKHWVLHIQNAVKSKKKN